jgi:hypothetical protein
MVQARMITTGLKSYFYIIVALASILGSVIATPYISNFVAVSSSDPSRFTPTASAQSLPFTVDHHIKIKEKVADAVRVEEWMNDADRNCEMSCTYVQFNPGRQGRAGLAYVADTPLDLSGAERVHFFLMGDKGGEMVKVKIAGKNPTGAQKADSPFKEKFAKSTNVIKLSNDWKRYEISLAGVDLKGITAPFAIELLKGNKTSATQAIYFKFIVYEEEPVDQRFALAANTTDNATAMTTTDNATAMTTTDNATAMTTTDNATAMTTTDNATAADEGTGNETTTSTNDTAADTSEEQISNDTDIAPVEGQDDENLAPIAMLAVDSLIAHPGDRVMLDGSLSNDPDRDQITYQWSQSDGPDADIIGADTAIPTVTIPPTLDRNDQITIDLVVSDDQAESNKASAVIDVQYVEAIESAREQNLAPDDDIGGKGWSDAACGNNNRNAEDATSVIITCLTDNSDGTFVSSDSPGKTTDLLFSFPQFNDPDSLSGISNNNIAYVTAQVTAKKTDASGFISFLIDDPTNVEHYTTSSISIPSDSFQRYSFTWKYNPVTGGPWTADSLNSLVAGYRHTAGQGSIQTSEFKLIVTALIGQEEQEQSAPPPPPPPSSTVDEGTSTAEEPAPNDGDIAIDKDAPTEDNVQDESGIDSSESEQDDSQKNSTITNSNEPTAQ